MATLGNVVRNYARQDAHRNRARVGSFVVTFVRVIQAQPITVRLEALLGLTPRSFIGSVYSCPRVDSAYDGSERGVIGQATRCHLVTVARKKVNVNDTSCRVTTPLCSAPVHATRHGSLRVVAQVVSWVRVHGAVCVRT